MIKGIKISNSGIKNVEFDDVYGLVDSIRRTYQCKERIVKSVNRWRHSFNYVYEVVVNGKTLRFTPDVVMSRYANLTWKQDVFRVEGEGIETFFAKSVQQGIVEYVEGIIDNASKVKINNVVVLLTEDADAEGIIERLIDRL